MTANGSSETNSMVSGKTRAMKQHQMRRGHAISRVCKVIGLLLSVAAVAMLFPSPAQAAVQRQNSRAYNDCTMRAYLDQDAGGIRAGANVSCTKWHPSLSVHTHLQYYDANYWNPVENNHWRNAAINTWGPYSGYGMNGTLWTAKWTGCVYWRAETQMSLTNSLPTAQQYVATAYLKTCA